MASWGGALDFSQDDTSGGGSPLVNSILTDATSLGQSYILTQQAPNPVLSYPVAPPSTVGYGGALSPFNISGKSSNSSMLVLLVVLVGAAFFFVKK